MRKLIVVVGLLFTGCTSYMELQNTSDRIWIMSRDGKYILRCFDMTAPGTPLRSKPKVFCKEAWLYGTVTNPDVDNASPPSHE